MCSQLLDDTLIVREYTTALLQTVEEDARSYPYEFLQTRAAPMDWGDVTGIATEEGHLCSKSVRGYKHQATATRMLPSFFQ